jgi:hypothetical protein
LYIYRTRTCCCTYLRHDIEQELVVVHTYGMREKFKKDL